MRTLALVAALVIGGCRSAGREALDVYAASSLTEAFAELEQAFEGTYPDVDVRLTLAGSQVLRLQIEQGAPADVYASANPQHMRALVDEGLVHDAIEFAANELVVIVPQDNPAGIEVFDQLPLAEGVVLGTANVPAGLYAREVLKRSSQRFGPDFAAQVLGHVVSEESNVRLARAKVELGEADAALVYRTDAISSDRVRVVEIPEALNVKGSYLIGVVGDAGPSADEWVALVLSPSGRAVLQRHGFSVE